MKLSELIERKKNDPKTKWEEYYHVDLPESLNFNEYIQFDGQLKFFWLKKTHCTDTQVGDRVYFLSGELVATSYQHGRKFRECFTFVSKEAEEKVFLYIKSLIEDEEEKVYVDLEEDVDDYYTIEKNYNIPGCCFNEYSVIVKESNEKVKIVYDDFIRNFKITDIVTIKFQNGKTTETNMSNLLFSYFD